MNTLDEILAYNREFVKNDYVIFKYVPPSVAEYIQCKKLYK